MPSSYDGLVILGGKSRHLRATLLQVGEGRQADLHAQGTMGTRAAADLQEHLLCLRCLLPGRPHTGPAGPFSRMEGDPVEVRRPEMRCVCVVWCAYRDRFWLQRHDEWASWTAELSVTVLGTTTCCGFRRYAATSLRARHCPSRAARHATWTWPWWDEEPEERQSSWHRLAFSEPCTGFHNVLDMFCLALDRRRGRDTSLAAADRMQYDGRLRDTWRRFGHIETGPPSTDLARYTQRQTAAHHPIPWRPGAWSGLVLSDFAFTGPPDGWAVNGWHSWSGGKQTWDNN
ncbi:hypothetical protein K456DRAFT_1761464 [Colletotrichum gloeosporioides 23]|nr:hypothetical protein K456DRAFT_1761464 [Colletotrichum gloeosporioides 23]